MNKEKSVASDKSGSMIKMQQKSSANSRSSQRRGRMHMVQSVLLIWLDSNIDQKNHDYKDTIAQLRQTVNNINLFADSDQCMEFLNGIQEEKACIMVSGSLGRYIVPSIHDMRQVDSIFIFCSDKKRHEGWAKDWPKIKGVLTDIKPICKALKQVVQHCEHNAMSISFMSTNSDAGKKNLDQLDVSFMYTKILKETLLTITFKQEHFKEFVRYCQEIFAGNEHELHHIKELRQQYGSKTPIWWYTCESFLYPMLNRALRTMDADIIVRMGFFIVDLHRHIKHLHLEQFHDRDSSSTFLVYRGQGLLKADFDQLMKTKGGLLAFNNFLSTSKDRDISQNFAKKSLANPDMVGILFVMTIDPAHSTTPFASTTKFSYYKDKEDEILFSMHSVFRIRDIKPIGGNYRLYQVDLILTSENDQDLHLLTESIQKNIPGTGWYRLGELLRQMGQFDKAEEIYQLLLGQTTDENEKAAFYHQLALAKYDQGEYEEAITQYENSLEIKQKTLPAHHLSLATLYNNIGLVYYSMADHPKALANYEKALEIKLQSLPSKHPSLGASYNNIGVVYGNIGNYSKALSYYEKALVIRQQSLPSNHPDLAASYNNIGVVHYNLGEPAKALSNYEKALAIKQQSLPPNHPDLGGSYNNIGLVYYSKGDNSKALSNYEKSLAILKQSLPSNHPDLGMSYNNIGAVYEKLGDYSKAYSFYQRAVKIAQHSLPENHPDRLKWKKRLEDMKKKL